MKRVEVSNFLQGLRGSQPIVVLTFLALRCALCLDDLKAEIGRDADAITTAVKGLEAKGMLVRQVGAHGKPYWMPVSDSFFGILGQTPVFPESGSVVAVDSPLVKISLSDSTTTTTTGAQTPRFSESGKEKVIFSVTSHKTEAEYVECLAVLKELNIHGAKARKLAWCEWVTPDYIRGHVAAALAEVGKWDKPLSGAIYLMENNFPVSDVRENGHSQFCSCAHCQAGDFRKPVKSTHRYSGSLWFPQDPDQDPDDRELRP